MHSNLHRSTFILIFASLALSLPALGQIRIWTGGANNNANWSGGQSNNNWNPTGPPAAGNTLQFAGNARLTTNNNTAAGTSYAGLVFMNGAGAFTHNGFAITLDGNVINNSTNIQTINFGMALSGNREFAATNGNLVVGGLLSGGAGSGLTKTGDETLTLSANNTFTGDALIKAGTLELTGSGSLASANLIVGDTGSSNAILDATGRTGGFVVGNGQTVSGIGTINASTTIQSGGILAPGDTLGVLNHTGNIGFQSGSNFSIDLINATPGNGYNQLNVTGGISLAGLLAVSAGAYTPVVGDLFFIMLNDGTDAVAGAFSNAPTQGGTYTFDGVDFQISYQGDFAGGTFTGGNDVVLAVIPEPRAALLGGFGCLLILRRRRAAQ